MSEGHSVLVVSVTEISTELNLFGNEEMKFLLFSLPNEQYINSDCKVISLYKMFHQCRKEDHLYCIVSGSLKLKRKSPIYHGYPYFLYFYLFISFI